MKKKKMKMIETDKKDYHKVLHKFNTAVQNMVPVAHSYIRGIYSIVTSPITLSKDFGRYETFVRTDL